MPATNSTSDDRATSRFRLLILLCKLHIETFEKRGVQGLRVNSAVLRQAIDSHFQDIDRAKEYHGSDWADAVKQAAYTIKWLCKLRPISFETPVSEVKAQHHLINEAVAWHAAFIFLDIARSQIDVEVYSHLLYSCHYRSLDEDFLLLVCKLLQDRYRTGT